MLPAIFSGVIWVLAPLRLDELGASGVAVGPCSWSRLWSRALQARRSAASRTAVGGSGRSGSACSPQPPPPCFCPCPRRSSCWACASSRAELALGFCWTPAMALLSDMVERAGVAQWLAFALIEPGVGRRPGGRRLGRGRPRRRHLRRDSPTPWWPASSSSAAARGRGAEPRACSAGRGHGRVTARLSATGMDVAAALGEVGMPAPDRGAGLAKVGRDRRRRRPQRPDGGGLSGARGASRCWSLSAASASAAPARWSARSRTSPAT